MSIREQLLECKSYEDAKPILETVKAKASAHELLRTAYGIQSRQPSLAKQFKETVIQEMEDDEEHKKKEHGVQEVDGGESEQSSSTTGLEKKGTEHNAAEKPTQQHDKKDQMGVPINEMGNGNGYPPNMIPQPQQQMNQNGTCNGQHPPMPQQQLQYAINEALKPVREAIKQLDNKIKETQKEQPRTLEVGSMIGQKSFPVIKETSGTKREDLQRVRDDITKMNNLLNTGKF